MQTAADPTARRRLLDRWELDHEPLLRSLRDNALASLRDLEVAYSDRRFGYGCQTVSHIVEAALGISGYAADFIGQIYGSLLIAAADIRLAEDLLDFDYEALSAECEKWRKRSEARRAVLVRVA